MSFSLRNDKSKQGDTGRSNQFHSVDLAFQPEGLRLASRYVFFTSTMSNYVIVLLAEDRCCTHRRVPLCGLSYQSVEKSVTANVCQPSEVQQQSLNEEKVCVSNM